MLHHFYYNMMDGVIFVLTSVACLEMQPQL